MNSAFRGETNLVETWNIVTAEKCDIEEKLELIWAETMKCYYKESL